MRPERSVLVCLGLALVLVACGGSSSAPAPGPGPGPSPGEVAQRTVQGTVQQPSGAGLPGATVSVGGAEAITDANGSFVVVDPPPGTQTVEIDGTTANIPGARFPVLDVMLDVAAEGVTELPQRIVLPDRNDPAGGTDMQPVDGTGALTADLDASNAGSMLGVTAATGTVINIDGQPATGMVEVTITPVPAAEVPMPLPTGFGASFATIQPANASFDSGGGQGIDIQLPNTIGFAAGSAVDIWSFDHDVGDWVNRSQQTGNQGVVAADGLSISGCGVITEGGWHTPVQAVLLICATTIDGRVVDTAGTPIPGAKISTSFGQFGTTAADGTFSIGPVPGYDPAAVPACSLRGFTVEALTPVGFGAVRATINVGAGTVVGGGATNLGDITVTVPATGTAAGLVTDNGVGVNGAQISIVGPTTTTATTSTTGSFFVTGLQPGAYTASFLFPGDTQPTVISFNVQANQTTTVAIQRGTGTGTQTVTVLVLLDDDDVVSSNPPVSGAKVTLIGSDTGSAGGLIGVTNAQGQVTFQNVSPPFTVTAQHDAILGDESGRLASTLFGLNTNDIGILLFGAADAPQPTLDATLQGTVSNLPALGTDEGFVVSVTDHGENGTFRTSPTIPATGNYNIPIPSDRLLNVSFQHVVIPAGSPRRTLSAILLYDLQGTSGQTLTQDFNFNDPARVDFNRQVTMTYNNVPAGFTGEFLDVFVADPNAPTLSENFFSLSSGGLPATVNLPDANDLAGLAPGFGVSVDVPGGCLECEFDISSNPTSLTVNFLDVPAILAPLDGSTITVAQARNLTVTFTAPGGAGFNAVFIESQTDPGLGVDFIDWAVIVPPGTTSFTLPTALLDMFSPSTDYRIELSLSRNSGAPVSFDTIFTSNLNTNIAMIETLEDCSGDTQSDFSTGP